MDGNKSGVRYVRPCGEEWSILLPDKDGTR